MKLITGDKVLVTGGKDKGKKGEIVKVFPKKHRVLVKDVNIYAKHVKPQAGRPGEIVRRERPLPTANVAILNDKGEDTIIFGFADKRVSGGTAKRSEICNGSGVGRLYV